MSNPCGKTSGKMSLAQYCYYQLFSQRINTTPGLTLRQFDAQLRTEISAIENHPNAVAARAKGKK